MLLDQIKQDQLTLRKGDRSDPTVQMKINALTTLIGEASPAGNQVATDESVQAVVRKFMKNLDESLAVMVQRTKDITETSTNADVMSILQDDIRYTNMLIERAMYASYLPAVFDVADINKILDTMPSINIGAAMGACKKAASASGKMFDGALVQKAIKERV